MASKQFLIDLDLNRNQLLNAVLQNLVTPPGHKAGLVYYNSGTGKPMYSDGSAWKAFGQTLAELGGEPALPAGGGLIHYLRGDKTWATLNTAAVPESGGNLYFTTARVNSQVQSYTGDVTMSNSVFTLATVNATTGDFGTTVRIPKITVNGKGLITQVVEQPIPTASGSATGLLSSANWTAFNGKQNALNGTGYVKMSGTTVSYINETYLKTSGGILSGELTVNANSNLQGITLTNGTDSVTLTVVNGKLEIDGDMYATGDVSSFGVGGSGGGGISISVYDGLDSTDSALALAASQGRALNIRLNQVEAGTLSQGADIIGDANISGDAVITGNLTVNGTTTTVNSTTISVADKNIELGLVATPTNITANGGGITLKGDTDKTFNWVSATGAWTSSENIDLLAEKSFKMAGVEVIGALGVWKGGIIPVTKGGTGKSSWTTLGAVWASTPTAFTSGILPVAYGGTGKGSYTVGSILYASGATALAGLEDVAVGSVLRSGGVGAVPTWGKVSLTSHITGTLGVANGGTGFTEGKVARLYSQALTGGTYAAGTHTYTVTHELVGLALVQVVETSTGNQVECAVTVTTTSSGQATIKINSDAALTGGTYTCIIVG